MRWFLIIVLIIFLFSCYAPVFKSEKIESAITDISFEELRQNQEQYREKIFLIGGMVVNIKNTDKGSIIEALFTPVDSKGYIIDEENLNRRFLATTESFLDPIIYKSGRFITILAFFEGTEKGRIGDIEYTYPVFRIKDIHLWRKEKIYPVPYWWYDPWYYPSPWWYDSWWYRR